MSLAPTDDKPPTEEGRTIRVGMETWVPVVEAEPTAPPEFETAPADQRCPKSAIGFWRRHRLFFFTVVLPMAVAGFFLLFVLTPRYSSNASFIVRSVDK